MDGRNFALLERFAVDESGWPISFQHKVEMPACTHIIFMQHDLKVLPLLQSNFQLPSLEMWECGFPWEDSRYDKQEISALQMIQAKKKKFKFKFCKFWMDFQGLFDLLEFKHEIEKLELQFDDYSALQNILLRFSEVNESTGKVSCPNMKALDLHFNLHFSQRSDEIMQLIDQSCTQMMDKRRLTGHPMEKCYIWWDGAQSGPPALVLRAE